MHVFETDASNATLNPLYIQKQKIDLKVHPLETLSYRWWIVRIVLFLIVPIVLLWVIPYHPLYGYIWMCFILVTQTVILRSIIHDNDKMLKVLGVLDKLTFTCFDRLQRLVDLDLRSNSIGEKGMEYLAPSIKGMTAMARLDLGNNNIGEKGMEYLAPSIKGMTALNELHLHTNNVGEKGMEYLAPSINCLL